MAANRSLRAALHGWRLCGVTLYRRDPGVGTRYWHYWEVGPVIDNGEGPLRFAGGFRTCERDGCEARS